MARVDLDAARAARAEAQQEPHVVVFGGEEFTLPAEIPLAIAEVVVNGDVIAAMRSLLGDQWPKFNAHDPSLTDISALFAHLGPLYGFDSTGESVASSSSSANGSTLSRPTSNGSTGSTSPKRAGAKKR